MKKTTLEQIAKECKVTKGLVSRALGGKNNVSDETRDKITSMSGLRGEDKEDFLARIDAAESKTEEYANIIKCKNDGGMWIDNQCKIVSKPAGGSNDVENGSTGEDGKYDYTPNGNDGGTIDYNGYDVVQTAVSVNDYLKIVASNKIAQNKDDTGDDFF